MSDARLIADLLKSAAVSVETKAELKEFERALEGGALHEDDVAYLRALHRRLVAGAPAAAAEVGTDEDDDAEQAGDPIAMALASFDALYHPEHGSSQAGDKPSRDAIHAEFRAVLESLRRE
ncbi:MAG: hypothetical protein KIT81_16530 [Alphaproteobacteria bacterium]|nr:hypothetical protein [Alphaproteobacteria bacterium]